MALHDESLFHSVGNLLTTLQRSSLSFAFFKPSADPRMTLVDISLIVTASVLAIAIVVELILSFWVIFGYSVDRMSAFNSIKRWVVGIGALILISLGLLLGLLTNLISP